MDYVIIAHGPLMGHHRGTLPLRVVLREYRDKDGVALDYTVHTQVFTEDYATYSFDSGAYFGVGIGRRGSDDQEIAFTEATIRFVECCARYARYANRVATPAERALADKAVSFTSKPRPAAESSS